jgi:hypothetical protein
MCWIFTRKTPVKIPPPPPKMTKPTKPTEPALALTVSFCFDLTEPNGRMMEVGTLRVRGDSFASFTWTVDPEGFASHLPPFSGAMIRSLPETLRATANTWLPFKNRAVPDSRKVEDPKTLADYYCYVHRQSSVYVSAIEAESS